MAKLLAYYNQLWVIGPVRWLIGHSSSMVSIQVRWYKRSQICDNERLGWPLCWLMELSLGQEINLEIPLLRTIWMVSLLGQKKLWVRWRRSHWSWRSFEKSSAWLLRYLPQSGTLLIRHQLSRVLVVSPSLLWARIIKVEALKKAFEARLWRHTRKN